MPRLGSLLLLVLLVGCAPAPAPQATPTPAPPRHVVVGMPVTPPNLPHVGVYLARDLGYFTEEGVYPVNDGLPTASLEGTIKTLQELGTLQAGQTVTVDQLVDRRPGLDVLQRLRPMEGDPRWK